MEPLGRIVMWAGLALLAVGLLLQFGPQVPLLGRLPGDIRIERDGMQVFIPITSCIVVSLVFSGLAWLVGRVRS